MLKLIRFFFLKRILYFFLLTVALYTWIIVKPTGSMFQCLAVVGYIILSVGAYPMSFAFDLLINRQWFMTLPFSRKQLAIFPVALVSLGMTVVIISNLFCVTIVMMLIALLKHDQSISKLFQSVDFSIKNNFLDLEISTFAYLFCFVPLILTSLAKKNGENIVLILQGNLSKKMQWTFVLFVLIGFTLYTHQYYLFSYIFFCILLSVCCAFVVVDSLAIEKNFARFAIIPIVAYVAMTSGFLMYKVDLGLNSQDPFKKVSAIIWKGQSELKKQRLAVEQYLVAEKNCYDQDFIDTLEYYREAFYSDRPIDFSSEYHQKNFSFKDFMKNKVGACEDIGALTSSKIIDFEKISQSDFDAYLEQLWNISGQSLIVSRLPKLQSFKISKEMLQQYLGGNSDALKTFALIKLRSISPNEIDRKSILLEHAQNIPLLLWREFVITADVLSGQTFPATTYQDFQNILSQLDSSRTPSSVTEIECAKFKKIESKNISDDVLLDLNYCLRKYLPERLNAIEKIGFFGPPLTLEKESLYTILQNKKLK